MDRGARLAVDVGTVRVGVAASDPEGIMAFPVATIARTPTAEREVADVARDRSVVDIVVGLPRHLSGAEGVSAQDAREFAARLAELVDIPVRLFDERLSTSSASRLMRDAGKTARSQRGSIDAAAAVVILEAALDAAKHGNLGTVAPRVAREENHD